MTLTEIKKSLYRQKPLAKFEHCMNDHRGMHLLYSCQIENALDTEYLPYSNVLKTVFFRVPIDDIQDAIFDAAMAAQLLVRYIVQPESAQS